MPSSPQHLVVGAGVAGLYAALLLARRGRNVRVIERDARSGGLGGAQEFRGLACDLGSHRLHPSALAKEPFRELHQHEPLLCRPRRGVLLLRGHWVAYPPSALALLRALGAGVALASSFDRVRSALEGALRRDRSTEDDEGFESFVVKRVGEAAYRAFYEPYATKVWGIPPAELSQSVAKMRVSTTAPWTLVRKLLRPSQGAARDDGSFFVYPRAGVASIAGHLARELGRLGVSVECGVPWTPEAADGAPVLYSGDLADVVETGLRHRGLYLVYLALPLARASEAETYYAPESRYWFGRVSELQNYSPELRKHGETVLCVEIPEGAHGPGLELGSGWRLASLLDQLSDAGIIPAGTRPIEVRQRFLPRVYPLYRRGWRAEWEATMGRLAGLGRVLPFGRQGLFLHCNLDHATDTARALVTHLDEGRPDRAWFQQIRGYLDVRVRD
jgi:hypothetical protein